MSLAAWLASAAATSAIAAAVATAGPGRAPCFRAWATPIYQGVGWSHFVDVANDCEVEIACEVATTVDPAPTYPVRIPAGEIVRVRTRYGSFTSQYEPIVECTPSTADTPSSS